MCEHGDDIDAVYSVIDLFLASWDIICYVCRWSHSNIIICVSSPSLIDICSDELISIDMKLI